MPTPTPTPTPYADCLTTTPPTCHKITSDDIVPFYFMGACIMVVVVFAVGYVIIIKPFLRH